MCLPESKVETTLHADGDSQWHRDSNSGGEPIGSGFGDRDLVDPALARAIVRASIQTSASASPQRPRRTWARGLDGVSSRAIVNVPCKYEQYWIAPPITIRAVEGDMRHAAAFAHACAALSSSTHATHDRIRLNKPKFRTSPRSARRLRTRDPLRSGIGTLRGMRR